MQPLDPGGAAQAQGQPAEDPEETMALYREHGVNQFGGCLPLLIQLPFLLALYQALIRASNVVTLTAQQVGTEHFTQLKAALPGIVPVAGSATQFNAPVTGSCALPQFQVPEFSHFLPLNCQLIDPLKLLHAVNTKVAWLGGLDLARPDHVFALIIPGLGFGLSLIAVLTAILQFIQVRMTSPRANPDDPTAARDEHDDVHVPVPDRLLGWHLPQRSDPLLPGLHGLPGRAAVLHHGLGQPLPALRLAARMGARDR